MSNLRDLRTRIASVKSTRKITSAMKMVAAAKLRKAQKRAEQTQAYSDAMDEMLAQAMLAVGDDKNAIPLLSAKDDEASENQDKSLDKLYIVVSGERGLCGGFNNQLIKKVRQEIHQEKLTGGKNLKIVCIGKKAYMLLKKNFAEHIIAHHPLNEGFETAQRITQALIEDFEDKAFSVAHIFYSRFESTLKQVPHREQVVPYVIDKDLSKRLERRQKSTTINDATAEQKAGWLSFEPNAQAVLEELLPAQIGARIYRILLEVAAGEQAARMTAMDGATRNAGSLIQDLTLAYNRERQAHITREVTEIVSAAEAL